MPDRKELPPGLAECRGEIDMIDAEIVRLLAARLGVVMRAAHIKHAAGAVFRDEEREEEIIALATERAEDLGIPKKQTKKIFRQILRISAKSQADGD
jgi:chorismate mutase